VKTPIDNSKPAIPNVDFVNNTNQRTLCVLIIDASGSMFGSPMDALNQGLIQIQTDLQADTVARARVRILVIRAGDRDRVDVVHDWADAVDFQAPHIEANGTAPLGSALKLALTRIEQARQAMRRMGVKHTRPLVYMITGDKPSDEDAWAAAAARCKSAIQSKKVQLIAVGTSDDVSFEALKETGGTVFKLNGLNFKELFQFIGAGVASASRAASGQNPHVSIPNSVTIAA
jgi:uncharacterized protein YegL